jgi:ABC-type lipoprotein export system ATPase subunit
MGPSGSGKSTFLTCAAGFPSSDANVLWKLPPDSTFTTFDAK